MALQYYLLKICISGFCHEAKQHCVVSRSPGFSDSSPAFAFTAVSPNDARYKATVFTHSINPPVCSLNSPLGRLSVFAGHRVGVLWRIRCCTSCLVFPKLRKQIRGKAICTLQDFRMNLSLYYKELQEIVRFTRGEILKKKKKRRRGNDLLS